ncbi:MAG: hypothetical protein LIO46_06340 [Clostridiales bacterium]|nr:hypothetical protein [Clostridiales bacterium]
MGAFQFQTNTLELDIAGHKFSLNAGSPDFLEKISTFADQARDQAEAIDEAEDISSILNQANRFFTDTIDGLLGQGATDQIFSGREKNYYDLVDIIAYIQEEFQRFQQTRSSKYSPARVKRTGGK